MIRLIDISEDDNQIKFRQCDIKTYYVYLSYFFPSNFRNYQPKLFK